MLSALKRMFWGKAHQWPAVTQEEVRKRSRLLVIDDHDFAYQSLFQRDGYSVNKWDDVDRLSDIEDGRFDLVLLDMQGIGQQESANQGFGILKHLSETCPTLITVVYSNADWGLQYQEYFALADAVLPKSADYVAFKRKVDELLLAKFSLGFYVDRIALALSDHRLDRVRLDGVSRTAILTKNSSVLRAHLESLGPDSATIDRVVGIANVAIGIIDLWKP